MEDSFKQNKLEALRSILGLSNREFSEKIGVHETQYSKMKRGDYPVGDKTINKIKAALPQYNIDWILYGKGEMKASPSQFNDNVVDSAVSRMMEEPQEYVAANYGFDYKPNMYLVPLKAWGGFLAGYERRVFDLEKIPFPLVRGECFAFEIDGYSMLPEYKPNDYFVGSRIEGFDWLVKGRDYIFQTVDGLILKRFVKIEDGLCYMESLSPEYNPVKPIPLKDIKALYQKEGVWNR